MRKRWGWVLWATFLAVGLNATEKKWTLSDWLKNLDAKIRQVQDKHQRSRVAVAAVRGAKAEGPTALYWKGKKGEISDAELAAFQSVVALAQSGKTQDAQKALDDFDAHYPKSAMKEDVERTRALLASVPAPSPAPTETPAAPAQ